MESSQRQAMHAFSYSALNKVLIGALIHIIKDTDPRESHLEPYVQDIPSDDVMGEDLLEYYF